MPSAPELVTFGCRLNIHESAVIAEQATAAGLRDVVVVNTCAVTAAAEKDARRAIRKLGRERPDARIIVTGCAAQIHPEQFSRMPEVAAVLGNDEKLQPNQWAALADAHPTQRVQVNDIMAVTETAPHLLDGFEGRTRAFLQVQNGCDHRCTFCIIPFGRGNSRSVPIGEIVRQARHLVERGYKEIVLTGVDITSYGSDLPGAPVLGQMIRRLLVQVPELPRLRLSSLDPVEIDEDLWRLIAEEPRLLGHLHLSAQAGADMILKRMKRRHLRDDIIAVCRRARDLRPDIAFGADLITGFPTETEEHFRDTLDLVEQADLSFLHVFPYSERDGTPAARMPPVPVPVRKARAARLRALGAEVEYRFLERQIGREVTVLVETDQGGRAESYAPVRLPGHPEGSLVPLHILGVQDGKLIGRPSEKRPSE